MLVDLRMTGGRCPFRGLEASRARQDATVTYEEADLNSTRVILTEIILPWYKLRMRYTAFANFRRIASGAVTEVSAALRDSPQGQVLVFDDETGAQVDLDFRSTANP